MKEIQNSIKARLYDTTASPFLASLIISWILLNHEYIVILFSTTESLQLKHHNLYYYKLTNVAELYIYPLLMALFYTFIYPVFSRLLYSYTLNQKKIHKEIKQKIEDTIPITQEEAKELRYEHKKLESMIDDSDQKIKELKDSNQNLITKIDNLKEEKQNYIKEQEKVVTELQQKHNKDKKQAIEEAISKQDKTYKESIEKLKSEIEDRVYSEYEKRLNDKDSEIEEINNNYQETIKEQSIKIKELQAKIDNKPEFEYNEEIAKRDSLSNEEIKILYRFYYNDIETSIDDLIDDINSRYNIAKLKAEKIAYRLIDLEYIIESYQINLWKGSKIKLNELFG
jgi:chromosome segregation ATPase